uniref:Uncharacterized protein n=1 Tax=Pelodiscus sinensis TaxID=13735 RepID=K7EY69_PELSI
MMAPSRSKKTQEKAADKAKKAGKEGAARCEKKSPPEESRIRGGRVRKEKSNAQATSEEPSSEKEPVPVVASVQSMSKSQREARIKGGKEDGHRKQAKGERTSKGKDKREVGSGGKHGEPLVSMEKKKVKGSKQQDLRSGQGSTSRVCNEVKAIEDSKKSTFKRKDREQLGVSEMSTESESVKSFTVGSTEGSSQKHELPQTDRRVIAKQKYNKKHDSKATTIRKSGSQPQGSLELRPKTMKNGSDGHKKKQVRKSARASEEGKILESSDDESCFGSRDETNCTQARKKREIGNDNTQTSQDKRSSLEEELHIEGKTTQENWLLSEEKKSYGGSNKASSEREKEMKDKRQESEDEETISEEFEEDGKTEEQDKVSKQSNSTPSDSSEEDCSAGTSEDEVKSSVKGEDEGDGSQEEDVLEKDSGEEMSENDQAKSESEEDEEAEISIKLEKPRRKPLTSSVKAKLLNIGLSIGPLAVSWEGNLNDNGSMRRENPAWPT